jgi:hypothetical protein
MWQDIICLNSNQNSCIIIKCDNMCTMKSKDELIFVNIFFHPIPLVIATNVSCGLSKAIIEILVVNVTCDYILFIKISRKYLFFF